MTQTKLPLSAILVSDRLRADYGDHEMESLCSSLERLGLIQPIVVNQSKQLIAGGRRLAAATALGWTEIDVVYRETLSQDELHELELEENLQRKEMTWQERVLSVAKIHYLKKARSVSDGERWTMEKTGEMLGIALGKVHYTLTVAEALGTGDVEIGACGDVTEAIKLLCRRQEDAATRELTRRLLASEQKLPIAVSAPNEYDLTLGLGNLDAPTLPPTNEVRLSSFLLRQPDLSLSVLKSLPDSSVHHCITDPPYGIDMDNLEQEGTGMDVSSVRETHDVEKNQEMFDQLFLEVFRVMKDKGFFVLWCDIMQWHRLYTLAVAAGFRVQRWPIVWIKQHQCKNQALSYNFTKDTEIAMVCAKPGTTIPRVSGTSIIQGNGSQARERFGHPFAKPVECWSFFIYSLTMENEIILEPFAGRGSGVCVMLQMLRKVIAIEFDETHYAHLVQQVRTELLLQNPETKFV
jgi:ParB family chromosome partitioning protein